jgi:hypothetical protein
MQPGAPFTIDLWIGLSAFFLEVGRLQERRD